MGTPVAGLNVRPTHITSKEYYSLTIENLRTYPVYFPGREPEGYWEMLQHIGPKPLIEPEKLHILVENSGGDSPSSAEGAGIALANVRRRLEICYGSRLWISRLRKIRPRQRSPSGRWQPAPRGDRR